MINSNILSRELYDDRNDHRTNSTETGPQIVKLILYSKSQYNQINFTIDGHQFLSNLSVVRKVHLIQNID